MWRLFAHGPADATASPGLPHLNPVWFYLSGTGLPRLSWKRGREVGVLVVVVNCCLRDYLLLAVGN